MQAYELLENAPNEVNGFKKEPNDILREEYPFELHSEEENAFYQTLDIGYENEPMLWYESDKKAFSLHVIFNTDERIEFLIKEADIWVNELGGNEYDGLESVIDSFDCFEDGVLDFIYFLKNY